MKKLIVFPFLIILLFLVSCNKEESVKEFVSDDQLTKYVSISKDLSESIHKNSTFKDLQKSFNKHKGTISKELYSTSFDLSKLEVQNKYYFNYEIVDSEMSEVFMEKIESEKVVNVIVVTKEGFVIDEDVYKDEEKLTEEHELEPFYVNRTDVFRFKEGKLVEYIQYW